MAVSNFKVFVVFFLAVELTVEMKTGIYTMISPGVEMFNIIYFVSLKSEAEIEEMNTLYICV